MIGQGETNEWAAEILFFLPDDANLPYGKLAHVFVLGEVEYYLGAWADVPLVKIIERGHGWYAIRLTAAQCVTALDVPYSAVCSGAQPDRGTETIGTLGGEIPQNGIGVIPFYLPQAGDPVYGPPIEGHVFVAGEVELSLPDGTFIAIDPVAEPWRIIERGNGLYWVVLTEDDTVKAGKAIVFVDIGASAQPASSYRTILGTGVAVEPPVEPPEPVPVPVEFGDIAYNDVVAGALDRLPQQFRGDPV